MHDKVDVLIIGSGAAVAWSLAETKMRILCLAQGEWMKQDRLSVQRAGPRGAGVQRVRNQPEHPRTAKRLSDQ
jgi:choline dehydrogenase-like flavoprotein